MRHTALDIAWGSVYDSDELQTMFVVIANACPVSKILSPDTLTPDTLNPRRAAPPLMSHCPAGRRAPTVPPQQTLFVVLDQMGARHRAVSGGGTLSAHWRMQAETGHEKIPGKCSGAKANVTVIKRYYML